MQREPYFMQNPEWFVVVDIMDVDNWPEDDRGYHLTDKAPQEAIDSYNEFYGITSEGLAAGSEDIASGVSGASGQVYR